MNTTATITKSSVAGTILYDGDCGFCLRWVRRVEKPLIARGFGFETLQSRGEVLDEMILVLPDGHRLGGADAVVYLARYIWWLWPLRCVAVVPGGMKLLRVGYRFIARNRRRLSGSCTVSQGGKP